MRVSIFCPLSGVTLGANVGTATPVLDGFGAEEEAGMLEEVCSLVEEVLGFSSFVVVGSGFQVVVGSGFQVVVGLGGSGFQVVVGLGGVHFLVVLGGGGGGG